MRISLKELENEVRILNNLMKVRIEKYLPYKKDNKLISNIGHYYIGMAYGGYRLEKIVNESGGCSDISNRWTKKEIYTIVNSMVNGIKEYQYKNYGYLK